MKNVLEMKPVNQKEEEHQEGLGVFWSSQRRPHLLSRSLKGRGGVWHPDLALCGLARDGPRSLPTQEHTYHDPSEDLASVYYSFSYTCTRRIELDW